MSRARSEVRVVKRLGRRAARELRRRWRMTATAQLDDWQAASDKAAIKRGWFPCGLGVVPWAVLKRAWKVEALAASHPKWSRGLVAPRCPDCRSKAIFHGHRSGLEGEGRGRRACLRCRLVFEHRWADVDAWLSQVWVRAYAPVFVRDPNTGKMKVRQLPDLSIPEGASEVARRHTVLARSILLREAPDIAASIGVRPPV